MTLQEAARVFLKQYPTPWALRNAVSEERPMYDLVHSAGVGDCPYIADDGQGPQRKTIGYWLRHSTLDSRQIHAAITATARPLPVLRPAPRHAD
jgi:hypothetical protein